MKAQRVEAKGVSCVSESEKRLADDSLTANDSVICFSNKSDLLEELDTLFEDYFTNCKIMLFLI